MIIANCREKHTRDAYPYGMPYRRMADVPEDEISPYWEGRLKGGNREYVNGFDHCVEDSVDAFWDNLADSELLARFVGQDDLQAAQDAYDPDLEKAPDPAKLKISREAKLLVALRYALRRYVEDDRNMLVTSLLDGQYAEEETQGAAGSEAQK